MPTNFWLPFPDSNHRLGIQSLRPPPPSSFRFSEFQHFFLGCNDKSYTSCAKLRMFRIPDVVSGFDLS